ncbi:MAG: helix-turn-helix domain-containing protein [Acidaminobacteraceae bacterium]
MENIKEVLVVSDLEKIKALSNVYRISILEAFDNKPATAKMISMKLGEPHGKVNYHMKTLAKVGILKLVEVSTKLGVVEKYYMPVAKNFMLDSSVIKTEEKEMLNTVNKYSSALLEKITKDVYTNMEKKELEHPRKINYGCDYYLTAEEAADLNDKIKEISRTFLDDKKEVRDNTEKYSVSHLIIPFGKK